MKKVIEEAPYISGNSNSLLKRVDFVDTFSTTNHFHTLEEITNLIFNKSPKWLDVLFKIRNTLVKLIGIETKLPDDYREGFEVGAYVKFFKIYQIYENEIILGLNDTHLNFRALIFRDTAEYYNIKVTTIVEYNNTKGKIYMTLIKPFHRWVIKAMIKKAWTAQITN